MPTYAYACPACGQRTDHVRRMAERDDLLPCAHCGTLLTRRPSATQGLLSAQPKPRHQTPTTPPPADREPTVRFTNNIVVSRGGGFKFQGDVHAKFRDLDAITARPLFDLSDGATVDAANITHHAEPSNHTPAKPTKPRKRPRRRR